MKLSNFLKNYLSTIIFILFIFIFYTSHKFYIGFLNGTHILGFLSIKVTTFQVYSYLVALYAIVLIPYYFFYQEKGKALIVFEYLIRFNFKSITNKEKQAMLGCLVKAFFAPLMINWLLDHVFGMTENIHNLTNNYQTYHSFLALFNGVLFWALFKVILFLDMLFFTLGYMIEIPSLKNKIISTEPTLFGWMICLICYPPFNGEFQKIIGWYSSDFPKFTNPYIHIVLNFGILFLMGIYTWASVSLNLKASNLTNRGIVKTGVYKYIRHPAYISKNLAWWIGGIPIVITSFNQSLSALFFTVLYMFVWTLIYYLRAITEERHLLMCDNGYAKYMKEVKYRFIPGVF